MLVVGLADDDGVAVVTTICAGFASILRLSWTREGDDLELSTGSDEFPSDDRGEWRDVVSLAADFLNGTDRERLALNRRIASEYLAALEAA